MTRPAETIQATVGAVIGALLVIYGAVHGGFDFGDLKDPEVAGAITVLVSFISAAVTWWTARKQRDPNDSLGSAPDGRVVAG